MYVYDKLNERFFILNYYGSQVINIQRIGFKTGSVRPGLLNAIQMKMNGYWQYYFRLMKHILPILYIKFRYA